MYKTILGNVLLSDFGLISAKKVKPKSILYKVAAILGPEAARNIHRAAMSNFVDGLLKAGVGIGSVGGVGAAHIKTYKDLSRLKGIGKRMKQFIIPGAIGTGLAGYAIGRHINNS